MMESPQTQSEISIHQLVVGKPANDGNIPAQCELLRCSLQEGMDILLWRGHFARPDDAPRDKRTYFREINYIAAAFQYQKKNYNSA